MKISAEILKFVALILLLVVAALIGYGYYDVDRETDRNYAAILQLQQECRR